MATLEQLIQADSELAQAMLSLPERLANRIEAKREKLRQRGEAKGILDPLGPGGTLTPEHQTASLLKLIKSNDRLSGAMYSAPERAQRQQQIEQQRTQLAGEAAGILDPYAKGGSKAGVAAGARRLQENIQLATHNPLAVAGKAIGSLAGGAAGAAAGMGIAGVAGAAYEAAVIGADKLAKGLNVANNASLTFGQRQDELAKQLIPGAEAFIRLRDALNGVTEKLRENAVVHAINKQEIEQRGESRRVGLSAGAEAYGARGRAKALSTIPGSIVAPPAIDRTTHFGDIAYREQQSRIPLQDAAVTAQAESKAANRALTAEEDNVAELRHRQRLLDERESGESTALKEKRAEDSIAIADPERLAAQKDKPWYSRRVMALDKYAANPIYERDKDGDLLNRAGKKWEGHDKAGVDAAALQHEQAAAAATQNRFALEEAINRQKGLGVTAAERESAVRKTGIDLAKNELELLKAKEQRLLSQAQQFGAMNPLERAASVQAALRIKQIGLDNVSPEEKALASRGFGSFVAKREQQQGAAELKRLGVADMGLDVERGEVKEIQRQIGKVQTEVRVNISLDEAALANRIAKVLEGWRDVFTSMIDAKFDPQKREAESGRIRRNSAGAG